MQTFTKNEHSINVLDVDKDALYVMDKLRLAGHIAYLVGGGVRDLLLGRKPKDFDISTSAKPEEVKKLFRNCLLIGKRFRLVHVRFGRKIIEVSTFRAGDNELDELIVHDNVWGTPEEDVKRRDFTINGLFYDTENEILIDYVGGYEDAQKKYLRVIGQPHLRFKQDPVRMIRLLKFQARFGFEADPEAEIALTECKNQITNSSPARVLEEILRMLEIGSAAPFFKLLKNSGLLQILMPELSLFFETDDGSEVFDFLQEVDLIHQEEGSKALKRPLLIAPLVFPKLHNRISRMQKELHLGQINLLAQDQLDELCGTFLRVPRKLKAQVISLLTSQYRMTPIKEKKLHRMRIPRIADFDLAIDFLKLRSRIEPGLLEIHQKWHEAFEKSKKNAKTRPRKTTRRKRGQ